MTWPSRFGTLGEKIFGKDDPFNDVELSASRNFTSDEMPGVKHPGLKKGDPGYGVPITSKAKFRQITKSLGGVEVGNEFEKGYDPQVAIDRDRSRRVKERVHESFKANLNLSSDSLRDRLAQVKEHSEQSRERTEYLKRR